VSTRPHPALAFCHEDCLLHDTGAGLFDTAGPPWLEVPELHPENAERVRNMRGALHGVLGDRIGWRDGRHATVDEIATLHDRAYIEEVRAAAAAGRQVTATTVLSARSFDAATAASGTALAACDAVLAGAARSSTGTSTTATARRRSSTTGPTC
jgi:Histone deacetylase domain